MTVAVEVIDRTALPAFERLIDFGIPFNLAKRSHTTFAPNYSVFHSMSHAKIKSTPSNVECLCLFIISMYLSLKISPIFVTNVTVSENFQNSRCKNRENDFFTASSVYPAPIFLATSDHCRRLMHRKFIIRRICGSFNRLMNSCT